MKFSMSFLSFSFIFLCYLSTFHSVNSYLFETQKYNDTNRERMNFSVLRKTIEEVELVDGHAHNLVAVNSSFSLIHAFSLAHGDAVASTQYSLSFKVTNILCFFSSLLEQRFLLHVCVVLLSLTQYLINFDWLLCDGREI